MIPDAVFDAAADAVVDGDEATLKALLCAYPDLIRARSGRQDATLGATLLHYISANGIEDERQRTPVNAVAMTQRLLGAGADPEATADFYGAKMTTLGLLLSSAHPHRAGLQVELAEVLLDAGADGRDALVTALRSGYGDAAERLACRLPVETLPVAAGLGRADVLGILLPKATAEDRHQALALAALHGHIAILERLSAENLNRLNPKGFHGHATPLHLAVWKGHEATVRWLVERGARTDIADTVHGGTALDWARHEGQPGIALYLEGLVK